MDLTNSNPDIIIYNVLDEYLQNYKNSNYENSNYENIYLINNYLSDTINKYNFNNYNDCNNYNNDDDYNKDNKSNSITNTKNINIDSADSDEDVWESAINDEKFYINNKIARIFPVLKNFDNFSKIKIDDDSFCYITIREIADIISKIICYHLLEYNLNPQKSIIVDYTSGVGGNVLSFSKFFKKIYAIELDKLRAEYLENNIKIYGYKNIDVINVCAINFNSTQLLDLNPNVVFVDPPWGGSGYKNNDSLILNLGNISMEQLVIDISNKFSTHYDKIIYENPKEKHNNYNNKFIVLKLPKNYDVEHFYNHVKSNNNFSNYNICMYLYILNKMIIIVCELQFKYF